MFRKVLIPVNVLKTLQHCTTDCVQDSNLLFKMNSTVKYFMS